jgi:hypothetical protein
MPWETLIAFLVAALLTLFDLDRTFYIPSTTQQMLKLRAWWVGFVVVNGVLAGALYLVLEPWEELGDLDDTMRALLVGMSYLAIVRLKLTTARIEGKEVPVGVDLLYEGAKEFVFKRINKIAMDARRTESQDLANKESLSNLGTKALQTIRVDALRVDRLRAKKWVLDIIKDPDPDTTELDKKLVLAEFVLSGQISD